MRLWFWGGEFTIYPPGDLADAAAGDSPAAAGTAAAAGGDSSGAGAGTALRFSQQGSAAKKHMHAFFFYADCYHEAGSGVWGQMTTAHAGVRAEAWCLLANAKSSLSF